MFLLRFLALLAMLLTVGSIANALEPAPSFNVDDLVQFIGKNKITSVDALIPKLPAEIKKNVTFITDSQSLQAGSVTSPRAVIWNEKGGLVFTFNGGGADQRGNSSLELMQADSKTGRLRFFEIAFPKGELTEPQSCLQCHGSEPRPIWKEYPSWPDAFGSHDDFTPTEQQSDFQLFIENAKKNPRFQSLIFESDFPEFPYRSSTLARSTSIDTAFHFRPNLRLSELLTRLNAKRLASMIRHHHQYRKKRMLILDAILNCGQASLPSALPPVLKELGLNPEDFDIRNRYDSRENGSLDFVASYFDGSATTREYLAAQLIQKDPELSTEVKLRGLAIKYQMSNPRNDLDRNWFPVMDEISLWLPLPYQKTVLAIQVQKREPYIAPYRVQYEQLCSKVRATLPDHSGTTTDTSPTPAPVLTKAERGNLIVQERCIKCHGTGSKLPIFEYEPKTLFSKVSERTDPQGGANYRMPFLDVPLTIEERSDLLDYIRTLK